MPEINPFLLFTPRDAAKVLNCSASTIRNLFDAGRLSGVRLSDGQRAIHGSSLIEETKRRQASHQSLSPA